MLQVRSWPVPVVALLDEPAHLLTAWLVLSALPGERPRAWVPWALVGAVAIDVDHLPLYLSSADVAAPGGRPFSHSPATLAVLAVTAAGTRGRLRTAALGLAGGVVLHLLRDLATGPGVPLLWPLTDAGVRVPYAAYLAVLAAVAGVAAARRYGAARRPVSDPGG
ncbi:metal-dependent hydrolase [Blastococcus deserti]